MKYIIDGYFINGEVYQNIANNRSECEDLLRSISLNFSARFPHQITNGNGKILFKNDRCTIDAPLWLKQKLSV